MWLLILASAAAVATPIWYSEADDDRYMLKYLCLILWGATVMVFFDHLIGFLNEGGCFLELTVEATVLGFVMLIAALILWEAILLLRDPRGILHRKRGG